MFNQQLESIWLALPPARMVMYLQPEAICWVLKAAIVLTAYGAGEMERYDRENDTYVIKLKGWNARIYAKAETFDTLRDSMRDGHGSFGMDWFMQLFLNSSESTIDGNKSRSNSVVSGTSTSVRSFKSFR